MATRGSCWPLVCSLLGCATPAGPSSTLSPALGHSQPHQAETSVQLREPESAQPSPAVEPANEAEPAAEPEPEAEVEPAPSIRPPAPVREDDETLCRHITAVVLSESGNAAGLTGDQIDELIASCSVALAQDRRDLGEAEFQRRSDCVLQASTVEAISACQPR